MNKGNATNALVHTVSPCVEIPSKNGGQPFVKRELVIDDSYRRADGSVAARYLCIEFSGDRTQQLDAILPGNRVNVEYFCESREYNGRWYSSVRGLQVYPAASVQPQQPQPMQQPAPAGYAPTPAPAPGFPSSDPLPF